MASHISKASTAAEKSRHVIRLLEKRGQDDYIGEDISQLEHCLQAANQARQAGSKDEVRPVLLSLCPIISFPLSFSLSLSRPLDFDRKTYLLSIFVQDQETLKSQILDSSPSPPYSTT